MKAYWDSSARVQTTVDVSLNQRLEKEGGYTRSHSLTEIFSTLTAKIQVRLSADDAAKVIEAMSRNLEFVDFSPREIMNGLAKAQRLGVRGGRVHDYIHALAASKSGARLVLTMDQHGFDGLVPALTVEQV